MAQRGGLNRSAAKTAVSILILSACLVGARSAETADNPGIDFFGEVNFHYRSSTFEEFKLNVPFPPEFWEEGDDAVYLRTADPGSHYEMSDVELGFDVDFSDGWSGRVLVHVVDLYNRNPTSIDDDVFVREYWIRYGTEDRLHRPLTPWGGFIQVGKAPRFAKQVVRHLESYGLWGTAVNRFEIPQVQIGLNLGRSFYVRGQYGVGAPLFMRDPNALAGDNGTPERVPGANNPKFNSGFPILYDARPPNWSLDGETEVGAGLGFRSAREDGKASIDAMVWYYGRTLEDSDEAPEIEGSYYQGDIELLRGAGLPLPFEGDERWEAGLNVEWRLDRWVGFAQFVKQDIASLERQGMEIETAYHIPLVPLLAAWDEPVLNWVRPAIRYSNIENDFWVWGPFITPSMMWDWRKLDVGLRFGIVRTSDLTVEYSYNDAELGDGSSLNPNEWLVTLRIFW
jgi:hypothetical protein